MTVKKEALSDVRRKRVQLLKRLIVLSLITAILIPIILCIVLFLRVYNLSSNSFCFSPFDIHTDIFLISLLILHDPELHHLPHHSDND